MTRCPRVFALVGLVLFFTAGIDLSAALPISDAFTGSGAMGACWQKQLTDPPDPLWSTAVRTNDVVKNDPPTIAYSVRYYWKDSCDVVGSNQEAAIYIMGALRPSSYYGILLNGSGTTLADMSGFLFAISYDNGDASWFIGNMTDGVLSVLAQGPSVGLIAGDVVKGHVFGNQLTLLKNNGIVGVGESHVFKDGQPGFYMEPNDGLVMSIDNFTANAVTDPILVRKARPRPGRVEGPRFGFLKGAA